MYCAYNYYKLHVKVISGKCIHASIIAPGSPHNAMHLFHLVLNTKAKGMHKI